MLDYCATRLLRCAQLANEARRSPYYDVLSRGSLRVASHTGLLATSIINLSALA
jgi:hypothetical protein